MMNTTAFALLKEELSQAAIVVDILNQEQSILSELRFDDLNACSIAKEAALDTLNALTSDRHRMMTLNGFELTEPGANAWLHTVASNGQGTLEALLTTWSHLLVTVREAREQNRINGILINKHATRIQKALHTLRGSTGNANTYGPNGQTSNYNSPRTLVIG